jgi:hypothetical protein
MSQPRNPVRLTYWHIASGRLYSDVGVLPQIFLESDPRTAQEQANERYAHGGGWNSFKGFTLGGGDAAGYSLLYPEDPPMPELARASFHNQTLVLFAHAWVGIIDSDNNLIDVARMD